MLHVSYNVRQVQMKTGYYSDRIINYNIIMAPMSILLIVIWIDGVGSFITPVRFKGCNSIEHPTV